MGFWVRTRILSKRKRSSLSGELRIKTGRAEQTYQAGQVFHLLAGEPHAERYGPEGVAYLVGRK